MSNDLFDQPTGELDESHDDEVPVPTSTTADPLADQLVEGEPKTRAEQTEAELEPTEEGPMEYAEEAVSEEGPPSQEIPPGEAEVEVEAVPTQVEVERDLAKGPWWDRLIGSLFGRGAEAMVEVETPPEEKEEEREEEAPAEELPPEVAVAEAIPPVAEVAVEPAKKLWWKRLVENLFRREAGAEAEVESLPTTEAVLPLEIPEEMIVPELEAEVSSTVVSLTEDVVPEQITPPRAVPELEEEVPWEAVAPAAPPLTADDVRALVAEELALARDDIVRLMEVRLSPEREERRRTSLTALQAVADSIYDVRAESIRVELEVLEEEEKLTLQERSKPLSQRLEEVDFIRERMTKAAQAIADLEAAVARPGVEITDGRAELAEHGVVPDVWEEVERQKDALARLEDRLASSPRVTIGGGLGLWPTVLALALVVAVGLAGILLPRQGESAPAPSFLIEMATMYYAAGETDEAIRVLDEAVKAGIDDVGKLGRVGDMYRVLEEYDKAIAVLERALEQEPQNQQSLLSLARSYGSIGQHWKAVSQYEKLLEIAPRNVWYHAEMAQRYKSMKLYEEAIAQYQNILDIDPKLWQAYFQQGEAYRALDRYDEAVERYQRAMEIEPNDYLTRVMCGVSYAAKNDLTHAVEQFEAAMEIDPDRSGAYHYQGETYLAQGHFDRAVESYQQAIERNAEYAPSYVGLGKAYAALDDCPDAIIQFTAALRLDPDNVEAEEGLEACVEE